MNALDDAMRPARPVDELLDSVADAIRRYVVVSDAQRDALTLWCAHCHAFDAAEATPYPHITSVERESGKTLVLEVCELLTPRARKVSNTTAAALARSVSAVPPPTMLLDESDNTFKRDREYVATLMGLLNDGYRRGGQTLLCLPPKWEPTLLSVFSPKAIAGIGALPDTIASRSIRIELKRKTKDERVARFRRREVLAVLVPLCQELETWAAANVDALAAARPELPDELGDGAQDCWEPLLAIAELAGGDWPRRARVAAVALSSGALIEDESDKVRLLSDVRDVFNVRAVDRIATSALIESLCDNDEAPWGDWYGKPLTARGLANLLRPFGIRPKVMRIGDATPRGFERAAFEDAWTRYLPHPSSESATNARTGLLSQEETLSIRNTESLVADGQQGPNPHDHRDVADVADKAFVSGNGRVLLDDSGRCLRHPDEPKAWCLECNAKTPSQIEIDTRPDGWAS